MVRVNLLPSKREARRASTSPQQPLWLLVAIAAVLVEALVLLFVHKSKEDELTAAKSETQKITAQIDEIKRTLANHGEITAQLTELRAREDAIARLQGGRTGPTSTMLELARVLSGGRGPTVDRDKLEQLRRDNPTAAPSPGWDPRRLWLTEYKELDRSVRITGLARDGEDVSEFLKRLEVSQFFYDVKLLPASKVADPVTKLEVVKFELSAKVRY